MTPLIQAEVQVEVPGWVAAGVVPLAWAAVVVAAGIPVADQQAWAAGILVVALQAWAGATPLVAVAEAVAQLLAQVRGFPVVDPPPVVVAGPEVVAAVFVGGLSSAAHASVMSDARL